MAAVAELQESPSVERKSMHRVAPGTRPGPARSPGRVASVAGIVLMAAICLALWLLYFSLPVG
jgi:hypothetical protein